MSGAVPEPTQPCVACRRSFDSTSPRVTTAQPAQAGLRPLTSRYSPHSQPPAVAGDRAISFEALLRMEERVRVELTRHLHARRTSKPVPSPSFGLPLQELPTTSRQSEAKKRRVCGDRHSDRLSTWIRPDPTLKSPSNAEAFSERSEERAGLRRSPSDRRNTSTPTEDRTLSSGLKTQDPNQ